MIIVYNTLDEIILAEKVIENNIRINTKEWTNGTYYVKVNNKVAK